MKILLTNDDGIGSEGLDLLVRHVLALGRSRGETPEVTVVAPKYQQSGKSHAIDIHNPYEAVRVDLYPGIEAWSVDSTPADCMRFAFCGPLEGGYDLVISGVNCGYNMGLDLIYSATCGAVFEAAALGCRGIAFSTHTGSFGDADAAIDPLLDLIIGRDLFRHADIFNVNIPPKPIKGTKLTRQAGLYFRDRIVPHGDPAEHRFIASGYSVYDGSADLSLDLDATMHGYVSVTPLTIERTDTRALAGIPKELFD